MGFEDSGTPQAPAKDTGVVQIRRKGGVVKEYSTVMKRICDFRADAKYANYSILTKLVHVDDELVRFRCRIYNESGVPVASGHAEEIRGSSDVNTTSALENAETSAIGRALAALGIGGTSFAPAEDVQRAMVAQDTASEVKKFFLPLFESAARNGLKHLGDCWAKPSLLKDYAPDTWGQVVDEEGKPKYTAIEIKRALQAELPRLKEISSRAENAEPSDGEHGPIPE